MKNLLYLAIVTIMVGCCKPCNQSAPKIGDLESGVCTLIEFKYNPIENSQITVRFDAAEKMMYGTAACNNFFGGYTLSNNKQDNIKFANVGATRKYCPDMEIENKFTESLQSVTKVKIDGNHLMFINSLDEMVALFVKEK